MKILKISSVLLATASILAGIVFFCIYHEWLVIYWNKPTLSQKSASITTIRKKTVSLFLWKHNDWYQEQVPVIWSEQCASAIHTLLTQWLSLLKEEGTIDTRLTIDSVLTSPSEQDLYISFNRIPFGKTWNAHQKHYFVEALLKTIRENNLTCTNVYLLVNHQPINDYHLDFSIPWPLSGFLET